jgi:cytochrome c
MPKSVCAALAAGLMLYATGALAAGDAAKGEKLYKKCVACHTIEEGGKNKVGPNQYKVFGRTAGTAEGYKYSKLMQAASEKGLTWDAETLDAYLTDPTKFLREYTGDDKGRSKMTFKLRKPEQRADIIAYLESLAQ